MEIYSKINITSGVLSILLAFAGLLVDYEFSSTSALRKLISRMCLVLAGLFALLILITSLTWLWLEG